MREIVQQSFQREGFSLTEKQIEQFVQYYDLLIEWNKKMNLTAIEEPQAVADKHFIDSALLLRVKADIAGCTMIDIGTGAGFPGIPLKILEPELDLTLFDSLQKRIHFLDAVCQNLGLLDVRTVHGRAEEFGKKMDYREKFDLATARAVARMPVLLEIVLPFVKVGGYFVALKGPELENELQESKKALAELGGRIVDVCSLTLADGNYTRNIAIIEKTKSTPKKYPRKAGTPQKMPLS